MADSIRRMRALMAGLVLAFIMVWLMEGVLHSSYPPPEGYVPGSKESLILYLASMPTSGFVLMLAGWAFSAFVGSMLACLLGRQELPRLIGVVHCAVLAGTVTQFVIVSYPSWVVTSAVFSIILTGLASHHLAEKFGWNQKSPAPDAEGSKGRKKG